MKRIIVAQPLHLQQVLHEEIQLLIESQYHQQLRRVTIREKVATLTRTSAYNPSSRVGKVPLLYTVHSARCGTQTTIVSRSQVLYSDAREQEIFKDHLFYCITASTNTTVPCRLCLEATNTQLQKERGAWTFTTSGRALPVIDSPQSPHLLYSFLFSEHKHYRHQMNDVSTQELI